MSDKLITLSELSDALGGLGRSTVYRHIATLPGFPQPRKIGGATRFLASDVEAFVRGENANVEGNVAGEPDQQTSRR